ncbi:MAG: hypothetical protein HY331_13115 [Chloroflexi bacterium]|nr:hypothetical protein [Chloroflexota bacterium]
MSHELHIENGRASMFYVDEVPWHKLGTRLKRPPTSEQAIRAANLSWDVVKLPLYAAMGGAVHPVPDRFAVTRADRWGREPGTAKEWAKN